MGNPFPFFTVPTTALDFGCITSLAKSTAATYYANAVSDNSHRIMARWAFLVQPDRGKEGFAILSMPKGYATGTDFRILEITFDASLFHAAAIEAPVTKDCT